MTKCSQPMFRGGPQQACSDAIYSRERTREMPRIEGKQPSIPINLPPCPAHISRGPCPLYPSSLKEVTDLSEQLCLLSRCQDSPQLHPLPIMQLSGKLFPIPRPFHSAPIFVAKASRDPLNQSSHKTILGGVLLLFSYFYISFLGL